MIQFLPSITLVRGIVIFLFEIFISYFIIFKYNKSLFLDNLCWIGNIVSNFFLFTFLLFRWISLGYFPLTNLYESLLFLAWCLLSILILLELRTNLKFVGLILIPISFLIISFATLVLPKSLQAFTSLAPSLRSNWLMMHVSMMLFSYSILLFGSLLSILALGFKFQKNINPNFFSKLSNNQLLSNLNNLSYQIISFGFPLLTIGIISGAVWANDAWGAYWSWDPKETWALITWIIYAIFIHARLTQGWFRENSLFFSSLGFLVIWVCYLGTNFLGQGLHTYGFLALSF